MRSVVELGDFVIVGALDATLIIHEESGKSWEGLDTVEVALKRWVLCIELVL